MHKPRRRLDENKNMKICGVMWQIDKNVNHGGGTRDRIRETTVRKIRSRRFREIGLARRYAALEALSRFSITL